MTIDVTVSTGTLESLTLTGPAGTPEQICAQMQSFFTQVDVKLVNGQICVETKDRGPNVYLTMGGLVIIFFILQTKHRERIEAWQ